MWSSSYAMTTISKALIVFGVVFILAGIIFQFAPKFPWLGRLPGDIYIKRENFSFYFPLSSSVIISIIISLVVYLLGRR